jgi:hypothetical protein
MHTIANGKEPEVVVPLALHPTHACQPLRPHRYLPANARGTLLPPEPPEPQRVHAHNTKEC